MSICKHVLFKTLLRWYNTIVIKSKTLFARKVEPKYSIWQEEDIIENSWYLLNTDIWSEIMHV